MKYFLVLFLLLVASSVKAAIGCVGADDKLYIDKNNNGNGQGNGANSYNGLSTSVQLNGSECSWVPTTTPVTSCRVTNGAGATTSGYLAYDTPQNCDIDTNVFALVFCSIGFGAFMLRKKKDTNFMFGSK